MKETFRRTSARVSVWAGSALVFLAAVMLVIVWIATGPLFDFSDTWQLFINTTTTILTFLMVFLIQNTQNRDGKAVQLKLDELIHSSKAARNSFVGLEDLSDEELVVLDGEFKRFHNQKDSHVAFHKLHSKIAAEHTRRQHKKNPAEQVLSTLFSPLTKDKSKK